MESACARSCGTCDVIANPCARTNHSAVAARPGSISEMFEAAAKMSEFSPVILSRDPWVLSFDNFVADEEVERAESPTGGEPHTTRSSARSSARSARSVSSLSYGPADHELRTVAGYIVPSPSVRDAGFQKHHDAMDGSAMEALRLRDKQLREGSPGRDGSPGRRPHSRSLAAYRALVYPIECGKGKDHTDSRTAPTHPLL